jgi:quinolinate synthase
MVTHAKRSPKELFLVATEVGILHRLEKEIPDKRFLAADRAAVCKYMKQITLRKLHQTLLEISPTVEVDPAIADRARLSIDRMLAVAV